MVTPGGETMRRFYLTVLLVFVIIATTRCGGRVQSPENLVQERCTRCHTLAPIEAARKTRHEWESTVYRMITRGARLNEREAKEVIEYLSNVYGVEQP